MGIFGRRKAETTDAFGNPIDSQHGVVAPAESVLPAGPDVHPASIPPPAPPAAESVAPEPPPPSALHAPSKPLAPLEPLPPPEPAVSLPPVPALPPIPVTWGSYGPGGWTPDPAGAAAPRDPLDVLAALGARHGRGEITDAEFQAAKAQLLRET